MTLLSAQSQSTREAELALDERLAHRRPLGFRGAGPNMTVQQLGSTGCGAALKESRAPVAGGTTRGRRGDDDAARSMQTLAGYQTALSKIIHPGPGGLVSR